ncbi:bifunctional chorismate-binding protein/class IV aminotransferase [Stenoxybacter acetivorans]|uniref:bifunctional chorismate-binding protein/class IV aminotransferase n=1 Tax=Stenoxybacter acetivorans TaxID=422441 RepID=UPI000691DE1D|nr:bifunctional anthranilate synthase component I family protein/class IV aminotransferase [Stenoxybacter acetivorans]
MTFTHSSFSDSLYFAVLDDAITGQARLFQQLRAHDVIADHEINRIDRCLQQGWRRGWHALLYLPYEAGYGLQSVIPNPPNQSGCLNIFWFAQQTRLNETQLQHWLQRGDGNDHEPAGIAYLRNNTDKDDYLTAVAAIQAAIERGDTYQINYTTRLYFDCYGSPIRLYCRLRERQRVPYGALACLPYQDAVQWTLCFSPELFVRIDESGMIYAQPMKGTAPLLHDGQDADRAEALRQDRKNRAENVMIVDLLRNDLGKIAAIGSVAVTDAFAVEAFGTVWQMTSKVSAQLQENTCFADVLRAAFPCGSITGAPKRMSMQIINQIETAPRGLYTGSLGFLEPCRSGLGFHGTLNVAIRTLQLQQEENGAYCGVMGVGSGIVADSIGMEEYRECQWKSRFLAELPPEFALIETLCMDNGCCALLPLHLHRLRKSAVVLQYPISDQELQQRFQAALNTVPSKGVFRVKMIIDAGGVCQCEYREPNPLPETVRLLVHQRNQINADFLSRHKTTCRTVYDQAWQMAEQYGAFDALLFNQHGYLLEGGRSNVFVRLNGQWFTPDLDLPLLSGVMRQAILADPQTHLGSLNVIERKIHYDEIQQAEQWIVCNALRGAVAIDEILLL